MSVRSGPCGRRGLRAALLCLALLACLVGAVMARDQVDLLADDTMPYDMAAVEEMEQLEAVHTQPVAAAAEPEETHAEAAAPHALNDPMTEEEQRFFSENDVDAFLEQRAKTQAVLSAKAQAAAKAKALAEAAHLSSMHDMIQAQEHVEAKIFDGEQLLKRMEGHADTAQEAELMAHSLVETGSRVKAAAKAKVAAQATAAAKAASEAAAKAAADARAAAAAEAREVTQLRAFNAHVAEVEEAGLKALKRVEFVAKMAARYGASDSANAKKQDEQVFLATHSKSKSKSPWWASSKGKQANREHYARGVHNTVVRSSEGHQEVANAAHSYSLPLSHGRINRAKAPESADASFLERRAGSVATIAAQGGQGSSVAFNPYNGAQFHPRIPVAAHPPSLPEFMAESKQPWAGAGYYGSGGGQGPHPGSEAFVPYPGVKGKEFGIRAREAWEAHTAQYGKDPSAFLNEKNLPQYPFFPTWSRKSEVGGRPDLFPRPLVNLAAVNARAQQDAARAFQHSNAFYPQFNRQVAVQPELVAAVAAETTQPIAGVRPTSRTAVRLIKRVIGYPRPEARESWASARVPEAFPQPLNSNSFDERNNYFPVTQRPVLGLPYTPLAGRNIMINAGPDKGIPPQFGGFAQYVPIPMGANPGEELVRRA